MNGIQEHVNYSTHYLWGIEKCSETDDYGKLSTYGKTNGTTNIFFVSANIAKPLGSMAENLARAKANFDVLESQLNDASALVQSLEQNIGYKDGQSSSPTVPLNALMVGTVLNSYLVISILFYFII